MSPSPDGLSARFSALAPRERRMLVLLACFLIVVAAWKGAWEPSRAYLESASERYRQTQLQAPRRAQNTAAPLAAILAESAQAAGISFVAVTPVSETQAQLVAAGVSFSATVSWLSDLENTYGITALELTLTKTSEGTADMVATLSKIP